MSLKELAARTPLRKVTWREGTQGPMWGRFAWLRVWPGQGWSTGDCAGAEPIGLLIEEQARGRAARHLKAGTVLTVTVLLTLGTTALVVGAARGA